MPRVSPMGVELAHGGHRGWVGASRSSERSLEERFGQRALYRDEPLRRLYTMVTICAIGKRRKSPITEWAGARLCPRGATTGGQVQRVALDSMQGTLTAGEQLSDGGHDAVRGRRNVGFQRLGVGNGDVGDGHALDGRLERAEALLGNDGREAGRHAAGVVALVGDD